MKMYRDRKGERPQILNLGTRLRRVTSFTLRLPLTPSRVLMVPTGYENQWSCSDVMDMDAKRKHELYSRWNSGQSFCSQSVYWAVTTHNLCK